MLKRLTFVVPLLVFLAGSLLQVGQSQNPPAPALDNVGFPDGYQNWNLLYVFDRPDNGQVRTTYANDLAFSVQRGQQNAYPYGSVVVMEQVAALRDANGNLVLDANGRFQKDPAATVTINVMRKGKGFGAAYAQNRNGEWEYVAYRPDKSYATTPPNSFSCAVCHTQAGPLKDWVFRASLHFSGGDGAVPDGVIRNYKFVPGLLHVKSGTTVTFYNDDVIRHSIADDFQGGWNSGLVPGGSSITLVFNQPGEFNFHCSIHPGMKGKVVVDP